MWLRHMLAQSLAQVHGKHWVLCKIGLHANANPLPAWAAPGCCGSKLWLGPIEGKIGCLGTCHKGQPRHKAAGLPGCCMGFNSSMGADAASKTGLNPSQQITQIQPKMTSYRCRCTKCLESRIQMPSDASPNPQQIPQMQAQIAC